MLHSTVEMNFKDFTLNLLGYSLQGWYNAQLWLQNLLVVVYIAWNPDLEDATSAQNDLNEEYKEYKF